MIELGYRNLEHQDFHALHPIVSDWHIVRQLGSWPFPSDPEFTRSRCLAYGGVGFVWGVFTDIGLIGTIGITEGELGYMLDKRFWDQGIGTRIVSHALTEAFKKYDWDQIHASAWFDNPASTRVLTKHGFIESHREIVHSKARDRPTPVIQHVLTREAYNALRDSSE
ncbi:Protein N-acetyltransferase, RimJ/RimL family [Cognatiyoonia koreensis]|uniref:Protein N-acetyltransferase, RimJ/RimL family n=1 Tax=Cognatiyoonia koreensis TaxID=364200 RepID=A0A1I0PB49_9RHOB|nr:GNAT family N-acetyltransferase [Cognatiyoonia koreensis]SEW11346.1 Protein N-acetyltransferase, RimJ/RimL family [Cognatiyoonia koreensis]